MKHQSNTKFGPAPPSHLPFIDSPALYIMSIPAAFQPDAIQRAVQPRYEPTPFHVSCCVNKCCLADRRCIITLWKVTWPYYKLSPLAGMSYRCEMWLLVSVPYAKITDKAAGFDDFRMRMSWNISMQTATRLVMNTQFESAGCLLWGRLCLPAPAGNKFGLMEAVTLNQKCKVAHFKTVTMSWKRLREKL